MEGRVEATHGAGRRAGVHRVNHEDAVRAFPQLHQGRAFTAVLDDHARDGGFLFDVPNCNQPGSVVAAISVADANHQNLWRRVFHRGFSLTRESSWLRAINLQPEKVRSARDARIIIPDGLLALPY